MKQLIKEEDIKNREKLFYEAILLYLYNINRFLLRKLLENKYSKIKTTKQPKISHKGKK